MLITEVAQTLGYFIQRKSHVLFLKKTGLVTFWAILSKTHLVAL
jgi:hypothetical protein